MTSNLNGEGLPDGSPEAKIAIVWRPSDRYPRAFAGYLEQAKVCAVFPRRAGVWEGKVFLVLDDRQPTKRFRLREEAEGWCSDMVRRWFELAGRA